MKIGDKVKVKSEGPYKWPESERALGKIGTVLNCDDTEPLVKFADWHGGLGPDDNQWLIPLSDLVCVEPARNVASEKPMFPSEAAERKKIPLGTGVLDYFSQALIEVARVSFVGNEQHNKGENLHWARAKSTDQADTIIRHYMERGKLDEDGMRHSAKLAWRVLALLQLELEAEGYPVARGAK